MGDFLYISTMISPILDSILVATRSNSLIWCAYNTALGSWYGCESNQMLLVFMPKVSSIKLYSSAVVPGGSYASDPITLIELTEEESELLKYAVKQSIEYHKSMEASVLFRNFLK